MIYDILIGFVLGGFAVLLLEVLTYEKIKAYLRKRGVIILGEKEL